MFWIWLFLLRFAQLSKNAADHSHFWKSVKTVCDVFNEFLLIDAIDRSKISSDQKHFFIALSLYPLSISRTLPLSWVWDLVLNLGIKNYELRIYEFKSQAQVYYQIRLQNICQHLNIELFVLIKVTLFNSLIKIKK